MAPRPVPHAAPSTDHLEVSAPLELIASMTQDFAASLDVRTTLGRALERITEAIQAEGGSLFLVEEDGRALVCRASVGPSPITGLRLDAEQGIVGQCVAQDTSRMVRDVYKDPHFTSSIDEQTGFVTRSILCAPLSVKGERFGAIEMVNKRSGDGLFSAPDLHTLQALASSAALAILNARMAERLVEQERVRRELEMAAEIQRSLLPAPRPTPFPVHGLNVPAREVSGDFYDHLDVEGGRVAFCVGDVSGKGMNAALLMAKTGSLFRCLVKSVAEPGRLLEWINREICETSTRGMFVTMVAGVFDPTSGVLRLANAGHEPPLLHRGEGRFQPLPAGAPPLGITPELAGGQAVPELELELGSDALYVFTDGVTEGRLAQGGPLGVEGLERRISECAALPAGRRLEAILSALRREPLHDDLTLLVVEGRRRG